jgi:hypothetical protein
MFAAPNPDELEAQRHQPTVQQQYITTTTTMSSPVKGANMAGTPQASPTGQPAQGQAGQTGKTSTVNKIAEAVEWGTQMLLIAFFSMLVMIISAQVCDNFLNGQCVAIQGYQVAAGAISLIVALIVVLVHFAGRLENVHNRVLISTFFFLWWLAAVIVLTFFGNFTTTNLANGYFGSWFAFITATFSLVASSPRFEQDMDKTKHSLRKPLFFLIIASAVVMGAAIGPCSPREFCSGYNAYAIVLGVVSLFVAIILFLLPNQIERRLMRFVGGFLVLWWIFGVACTTLGGPFKQTGNGYFGAFAALLASVSLLVVLNRDETV